MNDYILPVLLQLMGFAVIVTEIFIPSFGILTVIALGLFSYSLYLIFNTISSTAGMLTIILDLVLVPVLILFWMKVLAKSPLALRHELAKQKGVVSQAEEREAYVRKQGTAATDLRPAGIAEIDGRRLDVVTDGEYIEAGTLIVVTDVTGNRIVVSKT